MINRFFTIRNGLSRFGRMCLIIVALLVGNVMAPNVVMAQVTAWQPSGSGSETNPYYITVPQHLAWLKEQVEHANNDTNDPNHPVADNKYWELGNDIEWDNGSGTLNRIGNGTRPFRGHFNGNGYTINIPNGISASNTADFVGFFGMIHNTTGTTTIQNLTISTTRINGRNSSPAEKAVRN